MPMPMVGSGGFGMGLPMSAGYGMMSSPMRPSFGTASPMGGMLPAAVPSGPTPSLGAGPVNLGTGLGLLGVSSTGSSQPAGGIVSTSPTPIPTPTPPGTVPLQGMTAVPPSGGPDPLAVLNDVFVPLDTIQPGQWKHNVNCMQICARYLWLL